MLSCGDLQTHFSADSLFVWYHTPCTFNSVLPPSVLFASFTSTTCLCFFGMTQVSETITNWAKHSLITYDLFCISQDFHLKETKTFVSCLSMCIATSGICLSWTFFWSMLRTQRGSGAFILCFFSTSLNFLQTFAQKEAFGAQAGVWATKLQT